MTTVTMKGHSNWVTGWHDCCCTTIHPSIHQFIHPSIRPSFHSSIHPYVHPHSDPPIQPTIHPTIHPPNHPPTQPSTQPSAHPFSDPPIHGEEFTWFHQDKEWHIVSVLLRLTVNHSQTPSYELRRRKTSRQTLRLG